MFQMTRTKVTRLTLALSLGIGTILLILAVKADADPIDEAQIKHTIENAVRTMGEACIDDNHGNETAFKTTAEAYWSASTPASTELAERQIRFQSLFATPNPADLADDSSTMVALNAANPTDYPADKVTAVAQYMAPTPHWNPNDSPLQEQQRIIDVCQATYDKGGFQAVDFGVTEYSYQSIAVSGNGAIVSAAISLWSDYYTGSATKRTSGIIPWQFWLRKEQGIWKITRQARNQMP